MAFWANLFGYQATWFLVAWSAGQGRGGIGVVACIAFVAWQALASRVRHADVRVLLAALVLGGVIDGVAAAGGLLRYASPLPALPAPLWIVALWGAFALTVNHSLAAIAARPWLAALFGAVGGPLAYLGAARGFGAVAFPAATAPTLVYLAAAWAIALPLLGRIGRAPPMAADTPVRGRA